MADRCADDPEAEIARLRGVIERNNEKAKGLRDEVLRLRGEVAGLKAALADRPKARSDRSLFDELVGGLRR